MIKAFKQFCHCENGTQSIEALFAFPLLALAIGATITFWDGFNTNTETQRATYTVADMLSREKQAIDDSYLNAMQELFAFVVDEPTGSALRVTVVTLFKDPDTEQEELRLVWSEGVGGPTGHNDISAIASRVPVMAPGDQLIFVEGYQDWTPAFNIGLDPMRFAETAITRPRFAPNLVWDSGTT